MNPSIERARTGGVLPYDGRMRGERRGRRLPAGTATALIEIEGSVDPLETTIADVDPRGGFGLMFPPASPFTALPVSTLWKAWTLRRPSGALEIVPLFVVTQDRRGGRVLRVGTATPAVLSGKSAGPREVEDERRRHERVTLSLGLPLLLRHAKVRWTATLPVRSTSGPMIGVDLLSCMPSRRASLETLDEIAWEEIFASGWIGEYKKKVHTLDVRSVRRDGTCVARCPGLSKRLLVET